MSTIKICDGCKERFNNTARVYTLSINVGYYNTESTPHNYHDNTWELCQVCLGKAFFLGSYFPSSTRPVRHELHIKRDNGGHGIVCDCPK